jgi:hypothetical protein
MGGIEPSLRRRFDRLRRPPPHLQSRWLYRHLNQLIQGHASVPSSYPAPRFRRILTLLTEDRLYCSLSRVPPNQHGARDYRVER